MRETKQNGGRMVMEKVGTLVRYRVFKRRVGDSEPYAVDESEHNCFLVEGMNAIWNIVCGTASVTLFNASNAHIGVGDGTTAEDENQTGLTGTNKYYKGMASGYPQGPSQAGNKKAVFRSVFGANEANFAWNEVTVANGNSDSAVNLLRIYSPKGTKSSGEEWTAEVEVQLQNP
ncbi:MAG: hypothetical protein NZ932_05105 [Candidatus Bathyarchaeota archaeon]|nr:hypothetical protein [Candidatus Bathyarchaeota archaeon]